MFDDDHPSGTEIEDLSPDGRDESRRCKRDATRRTRLRRVNDELVGAGDLSESRAAMTELSACFHPGLLPQASGAADFLPRRIGRWRRAGVMRITRDWLSTAFECGFEFADATYELVVKLTLLNQLLSLTRVRVLRLGKFFREQIDDGLRRACEESFHFLDAALELSNEAEDALRALIVEPADVRLGIHDSRLRAEENGIGQTAV